MSFAFVNSWAVLRFVAIPGQVKWSYFTFFLVFIVGLVATFLRGEWQRSHRLEKLILLGPIFYAAPLGAFGTEHFTLNSVIASFVPSWIPWHQFWAYFVGACFIAAAFSMVTRIYARLSASLVALTFFLFVLLMDLPGWIRSPHNRIAAALVMRELAFSGGALAYAASLSDRWQEHGTHIRATIARYFVAIPVLFYSFEQFRHGKFVPGVPLNRLTPEWIFGRTIWTYLAAVIYAVAGIPLLLGKKTRAAAAWIGFTVFFVELVVYLPIGIVDRASLSNGLNYVGDTLMFCGAVLLLAGAMPRKKDSITG